MSDTPKIITTSNMQTVIAVCFILGLLALAFNFYNFKQIHNVTAGVGNLSVDQMARIDQVANPQKVADLEAKVTDLEGKLAALEEWRAAEEAKDAAEEAEEAPE